MDNDDVIDAADDGVDEEKEAMMRSELFTREDGDNEVGARSNLIERQREPGTMLMRSMGSDDADDDSATRSTGSDTNDDGVEVVAMAGGDGSCGSGDMAVDAGGAVEISELCCDQHGLVDVSVGLLIPSMSTTTVEGVMRWRTRRGGVGGSCKE